MRISFQETTWKVSRQLPVTTGWRAKGDAHPQPQESGLWFHSDRGETRFLALDLSELPTQADLDAMTLEQFVPLFSRAVKQ